MTDEKNILGELPVYSFVWPCLGCGAKDMDEAGAFNFDNETMEVTDCARCKRLKENPN